MTNLTRRTFGQSAAAATVATALSYSRVLGANDRVRVGFIGLGNRGDQVLDAFLEHKDATKAFTESLLRKGGVQVHQH